jgi:polyhydroxybutyrate depolymerase
MSDHRSTPTRTRRTRTAVASVACLLVVLLLASCSSTPTPSSSPSTTSSGAAGSTLPGTTAGSASPPGSVVAPASVAAKASAGCVADRPKPTTGEHVDTTVRSSGADRSYKQYVPVAAVDAGRPTPLVIDLHGYSEGNAVHTAMSNLAALAETKGFVLATPLGTGAIPYWNAVPNPELPNDVQLVSDVIDDMARRLCVDLNRVFVTGLSNGAFMTSLVACRLADKVAAVAPVAGLRHPNDCKPSRPVPIAAFHGTADQFVTFDGTTGAAVATLPLNDETRKAFEGLTFAPIPETLAKWAADEGCGSTAAEDTVSAHVKLVHHDGCRDGSIVELYVVDGGGHAWPGSTFSQSIERVVGPTTFEIDANQLMWSFFEAHPLAP